MKIRTAPSGPNVETLPNALVFGGPWSGAMSESGVHIPTASIELEIPAGETYRMRWNGVIQPDSGLERVGWRVYSPTLQAVVGGNVTVHVLLAPTATPLENIPLFGFTYLVGPLPRATYQLEFHGLGGPAGNAGAFMMCLEAEKIA